MYIYVYIYICIYIYMCVCSAGPKNLKTLPQSVFRLQISRIVLPSLSLLVSTGTGQKTGGRSG